MKFAFSDWLRFTTPMVRGDFCWITAGKGRGRIGKRPTHFLKLPAESKRRVWGNKDRPLAAPFPEKKKKNNREEVSFSPYCLRGGGGCKQTKLRRFFFFALTFFLVKFFSGDFLDFEWSTIISEHFEQDKHQLVWSDMFAKRLVTEQRTILSYF